MAEFPALPLWTDAYEADCSHLTDAEDGRYMRILRVMWRAPERRLPNDIAWIARKFRRSVEEAESEIMPMLREFCQCDGNWWTQKRLLKEWAYLKKQSKRQSENAKSRWQKEKDVCHGNAAWHTNGIAPTPTPTPTPTPNKKEKKDSQPDGFADWYAAYPTHKGRGAAEKAYARALKTASPETLLAGASRDARAYAGTEPRYIPHPATWLNQQRWLDEETRNGRTAPKPAFRNGWVAYEAELAAADLSDPHIERHREHPGRMDDHEPDHPAPSRTGRRVVSDA